MSKLKKFAGILLALVMCFGLTCTAFATSTSTSTEDAGKGSITIDNATVGETYTIYQMATVTYNTATDAYVYTATTDWESFFSSTASDYITYDSTTGIITWKGEETAARTSAFAALAMTYAETLETNQGSTEAAGSTVSFSSLSLGWYLVNSSLDTVCSITTTNPSVTIQDKNQEPGTDLDKTVSDTEAQIGDTVTYTITSSVPTYDGETKITNYTFTDTLSDGLTAPAATAVSVTIKDASGNTVTVGDGIISVNVTGQVITVSYDPTAITGYPADATITITYTATVNAKAAYANGNSVTQTWTGDSTGTTTTETVYTYGFELKKVDGTDKTTQLSGAKFKLYTSETGGEAIKFSYAEGVYTVNPDGDVTEITVGSATIKGLDADVTYYLEETVAPDGYNLLEGRTKVEVGQTDSYNATTGINNDATVVYNNRGSELPTTGGMGTTIFYVVGGALVVGAVVLLITKKRMSE